eukprot:scaffold84078_cov48-Phaeocystis_antarctica.AAC.4
MLVSREAERVTLLKASSKTGDVGVYLSTRPGEVKPSPCYPDTPGKPKPYQVEVSRGGKVVQLGCFATTEEAALCVARSPEGQLAAQRAAAAPLQTSEEARQQAQAERLTLLEAYFSVYLSKACKPTAGAAAAWR